MAKRHYRWFVHPLNSETNASFALELPEENLLRDVYCADGVKRTLWECPIDLIRRFWASRENLSIDFKIFNVCGLSRRIEGRVDDKTFLFTKRYLTKKQTKALTNSINSV